MTRKESVKDTIDVMWRIMFLTLVLTILSVYVTRRYKCKNYSTQKYSRRCDYMQKSQVSPLKVPWKVRYDGYDPLGEEDARVSCWWFRLTFVDGRMRFLVEVSPYVFCRAPYNPLGRTGVMGNGLFPQCGPNYMIMTILWSDTLGFLKLINGKEGVHLYRGYVDHPMNTDNAWVEADIYYVTVGHFSEPIDDCPAWLREFTGMIRVGSGEKEQSKRV